jgi:hypothetical protein
VSALEFVPRSAQEHEGALWCYEVLTPMYESRGDGYLEPPEWGCDYRMVYARNAKRAVVLAVRAWRRFNPTSKGCTPPFVLKLKRRYYSLGSDWVADNESDGVPPYKGVRASRCPTVEWIEANTPVAP